MHLPSIIFLYSFLTIGLYILGTLLFIFDFSVMGYIAVLPWGFTAVMDLVCISYPHQVYVVAHYSSLWLQMKPRFFIYTCLILYPYYCSMINVFRVIYAYIYISIVNIATRIFKTSFSSVYAWYIPDFPASYALLDTINIIHITQMIIY